MNPAPATPAPLLEFDNVTKHFQLRLGAFGSRRGTVRAVDGVSFRVHQGEALGLVGESGCGKSTVARLIVGLHRPTSGEIRLGGEPVSEFSERKLRKYRQKVQMIFQDPYASLNPRMKAGDIVGEPLRELRGLSGSKLK